MLKRTISGACFIAILAIFFTLGALVDMRLFSIFLWFICAFGTFEVARALKNYSNKAIYITQIVYGILLIPAYFLFTLFFSEKYSIILTLFFIFFALICILGIVVLTSKTGGNIKEVGVSSLSIAYPSILIFAMLLSIALWGQLSFRVLLLTFVISPLADTFAYLVGMSWQKIRNGNAKKLCPKLSPKKTVAGAIGGLIGGIIGSIVIYFIFMNTFKLKTFLIYAILGLVASIATEIGDLFESLIKRKVGIKDMGKIMPGHGGVMDRIDGISFAGVIVFLFFYFLPLF